VLKTKVLWVLDPSGVAVGYVMATFVPGVNPVEPSIIKGVLLSTPKYPMFNDDARVITLDGLLKTEGANTIVLGPTPMY
jgi:hypothetical protein